MDLGGVINYRGDILATIVYVYDLTVGLVSRGLSDRYPSN